MAAPTASTRLTPATLPMPNGFSTLITFAAAPSIALWEKTAGVTPPGLDGGAPVTTDTMLHTRYLTKRPRALIEQTESQMTVAYHPSQLTQVLGLINQETTITVKFPGLTAGANSNGGGNGGSWAFYGYLRSFKPNECKEGEQPTAVCVIQPTHWDPTNNTEEGPVYVAPGG